MLERPARILITSASAGTGHIQAAEALRAATLAALPGSHVQSLDILRLAPALVRTAYGSGFELVAARAPRLWKEIYDRTDGFADTAAWGPVAHRVLFRAYWRLLATQPWDVVLCTHFLPCQLAAGLPGAPPFALVLTDFTLHRYWVQRRVDRYFVATDALAGALRERLPGSNVQATGIPVHPRFRAVPDRAAARQELEIDVAGPVVLVMGGGMGLGVAEAARAVLAAGVAGLRVLAVTGSNERAREELAALAPAYPGLRVFGRVERVPSFMSAADMVVTKPGGLTISEALAVGRPLVLSRGIPGQESGNARELTRLGAALYSPEPDAVRQAVARLFGEPDEMERAAAAARAIGRPDAARDIALAISRQLLDARAA